jgi:predicted transcriptional regulator of viral defense system
MTQNIHSLSEQEAKFLSHMAGNSQELFTTADAQAYWSSSSNAANVLSRLVDKGWLKRVSQGLYMIIPLAAGPDRLWTENAFVIASHLIEPAAIAYWSALQYWNMTEQVPRTVFVQSTNRKLPMEIMGVQFRFVTVKASRFYGVVERIQDGKPLTVTDREKTLIDAAARPDLAGGILQLAQGLQSSYQDITWTRLDDYLNQWGGGAVVKRLGYLLESLNLPVPDLSSRLAQWQGLLSTGISLLEPGAGESGQIVTRWRIRDNIKMVR